MFLCDSAYFYILYNKETLYTTILTSSSEDEEAVAGIERGVALDTVAIVLDVADWEDCREATLIVADDQVTMIVDACLDEGLDEVFLGGVGLGGVDIHDHIPV